MKTQFFALLLISFSILQACKNEDVKKESKQEKETEATIYGTWTLYKENVNGKTIDHSGKPTALSLKFEQNGYYILFDKITDKKISDSGVDEIQERYKGQYEWEKKNLKMTHFVGDSVIVENFSIQNLSTTDLILENTNTKSVHYYRK